MSTSDVVANQIGFAAYFDVVYVLSTGLFYGLSLPVFAISINVLRRRARESRPTRFLLLLTYLTFLTTTGQFITNVGDTLTGLSWSQNLSDTSPYTDRMAQAALKAQPYGIASLCFQVLNFFAGDAIVVWRASVLWGKSRLVRYMLWLLLAGSAGASLYDVTNFGILLTRSNGLSGNGFLKGDAASMFVSFGVNVAATACIFVKAWKYRQSIRATLMRNNVRKRLPFRILLSLIECGLFYCAAQLVNGVLTLVGNAPSVFGRAVVSQFTEFFAGTYSALVISIIASQRSIIESSSVVVDESDKGPLTRDIEKGNDYNAPKSTIRFAAAENANTRFSSAAFTKTGEQSISLSDRDK